MSFRKWLEDYNRIYARYVIESAKRQNKSPVKGTTEIKDGDMNVLVWNSWDEKTLHLYNAYKTERTTKRLVWATWALAIGTLILSGLTLYFQYFK